MNIEVITKCRYCGSEQLVPVLSLGEIYPSNFVKEQEGYGKAPLELVQCMGCTLIQLRHTVTPDDMYRQYWYQSSLNKSMVSDLKDIVDSIKSRVNLTNRDVVVDIGCNDGTLLNLYDHTLVTTVGFDPALNLAEKVEENCDVFVNDYFTASRYGLEKRAKVVTAIAMFYDLSDPKAFIEDVKKILAPDGVFVIQLTDLYSMLKINAFDNICHEHLEYYTLALLTKMLAESGLFTFDVEYNKVNGGSVRVYACLNESKESYITADGVSRVNIALYDEDKNIRSAFSKFIHNEDRYYNYTMGFLHSCVNSGRKVAGLGASTKGNTLLQVYNITKDLIPYIAEVNSDKFGLKTIGTDIPIVSEDSIKEDDVRVLFLLPWHFIDNILPKFEWFLDKGGIIFTPLPKPTVYYKSGDYIITTTPKD